MQTAVRRHWPILVVAAVAAVLIFTHLGRNALWEDEGDTAILARSILQHGVPTAWDGVTFTAPDWGQRLTADLVMVSHPWLQYYAAAASFAVLGATPFAARLPFALGALATILIVYMLVVEVAGNRLAALTAAILVTVNTQFLIYARQARNYSLHALLTCLLVWEFRRLASWRHALLFAITGILLFHAHPLGLAALAAMGALTLFRPFAMQRRWFWRSAPIVVLYAAPWLIASRAGYVQNLTVLHSAGELVPRLLQAAVECASVTPLVGVTAMAAIVWLFARRRHVRSRGRRRPASMLSVEERWLVAACAAIVLVELVADAATHAREVLWIEGLHQMPGAIPLVAIVLGVLIVHAAGSRRLAWAALVLLFTVTRAGQILPWVSWTDPALALDPEAAVTFHEPTELRDRVLRTAPILYARSLFHENPGVIAQISRFLKMHAMPGDVVITNYGWEALYFQTGLPQGAKIESSFPIYGIVRDRLPDYVFGDKGVRWIVWRRAWPAYLRSQDCARILRELELAGVRVTHVASIPETLFENRENVHFHRFSGHRYLYPQPQPLPTVEIYRVDWPTAAIARG